MNLNTNSLSDRREEILVRCKNKNLILYSDNGCTRCKLVFSDSSVKYKRQGEAVLNSKIFLSLLENLKAYKEINFEKLENSLLRVSSKKFECNLIPLVSKLPEEDEFSLQDYEKITLPFDILLAVNTKFKDFYKSFSSTAFQKKSILRSINLRKASASEELQVLLTDSYRILLARFSPESSKSMFELSLQPEILNSIVTLFREQFETKEIDLYVGNEHLVVSTEYLIFKTKLQTGSYPNLIELFDFEESINFSINKNLLISAIERNLLLSPQNTLFTTYKIVENNLILEFRDSAKGSVREELEISKARGGDTQFALNSSLLRQLLKNIGDQEIIFSLTESFKPILLFGREEGKYFKQLILPLKYS
nr:DNA polymerase III subunit beta [Candidatus Mycoplasma haematolamae]